MWKEDKCKFYSECCVACYKPTNKEYGETSEYLIVNDQIGGKGISYDLSSTTTRFSVSFDGGRIRFALPQLFEKALSVAVEFDGAKLKATGKDLFT